MTDRTGGMRRLTGERLAVWCGIVAPVFALGCVGLATVVGSPESFTWAEYALSDLGRREASTFWLFNGGLVGGGVVGFAFAWALWQRAGHRLQRAGTITFALTVVGLALVGVFYLPHDLHEPVALLFFLGAPVTHALYGAGWWLTGEFQFGLVSILFGVTHLLAWGGWIGYVVVTDSTRWFAVPEMVAAIAFGCWSVAVARRFLYELPSS